MKRSVELCRVECYSGHRYAQEPRAFTWRGTRYVVEELQETWRSPRGLSFVVRTSDRQCFELIYNDAEDVWSLKPVARKD